MIPYVSSVTLGLDEFAVHHLVGPADGGAPTLEHALHAGVVPLGLQQEKSRLAPFPGDFPAIGLTKRVLWA